MNQLSSLWRKHKQAWIFIEPLLPDETTQAETLFLSGLLDFGEAEAIMLARSSKSSKDDVYGHRLKIKSVDKKLYRGLPLWLPPPFGVILLRNTPGVTLAWYARRTTWKI